MRMASKTFKELRELYNNLKMKPCTDCGRCFDPCCMDFDHRPDEIKISSVSKLLGKNEEILLAEIAKCDLVCACCHRIRTKKRGLTKNTKEAISRGMKKYLESNEAKDIAAARRLKGNRKRWEKYKDNQDELDPIKARKRTETALKAWRTKRAKATQGIF